MKLKQNLFWNKNESPFNDYILIIFLSFVAELTAIQI